MPADSCCCCPGEGQQNATEAGPPATAAAPPPQLQPPPAAAPPPKQDKPPELLAFEAGREVMEMLRNAHTHTCSVLEIMCTEIGAVPTQILAALSVGCTFTHHWLVYVTKAGLMCMRKFERLEFCDRV